MDIFVAKSMFVVNMGMYWILTIFVCMTLDYYARKKLGGKRAIGYKMLQLPKFFCYVASSAYTMVMIILVHYVGMQFTYGTMTYLGLPYFVIWVFVLVNVLRRVRAETKGKPWLNSK